jgi:hypothetical protein
MKGFIKSLLRESLITEDVKLAEKILRNNNIPLNDESYLALKAKLGQKNLGYLGQIVRLSLASNKSYDDVSDFIISNKEIIRDLPNSLSEYKKFSDLRYGVESLKNSRTVKKVVNMLTNKELRNSLLSFEPNAGMINNLNKFLTLDSSDRKEFLVKSDSYDSVSEFYEKLSDFIDDVYNFKFDIVLNVIKDMSDDDIRVLYSENNMILARVVTYAASKAIGSKSWCIVGDEGFFNQYTENGKNFQYFFFNFNKDLKANEKMIAFTMDEANKITACHDRYDSTFNNVMSYLSNIGIKSKIFEINSREQQKNKLAAVDSKLKQGNRHKTYLYYAKEKRRYSGKEILVNKFTRDYNDKLKKLSRKLLEFLFSKDVKGKNHLDIHINKFENVPITIYDYDDYDTIIDSDSINIVYYMLNNFDKVNNNEYEYKAPLSWGSEEEDPYNDKEAVYSKEGLIEILKKVYSSNIKMTRDSKVAISNFLKDNGVDILKLSQLKKSKTGNDLAPSEFGMLANRGEDMKASIQNKLSGLRRGEDINLNQMEIKYAIDNGFKPIIEKYYKDMLPWFGENQLSYDDLNIYKKLGLLNDIGKVIVSKVNNYGIDTLNSIERSLYDMSVK